MGSVYSTSPKSCLCPHPGGQSTSPSPNTHLHTLFSISCFRPHRGHILSCPHDNRWQLLGDRSLPTPEIPRDLQGQGLGSPRWWERPRMWPSYVWTSVPCAPRPGHPPADLIRQREMKWVEMTSHWEKTMSRRYKKVRGEWPHTGPLGLPPLYLAKFSLLCPEPPGFTPCSSPRLLPDGRLCLRPAESGRGIWHNWPNGVPWPHPQVKIQCRKGIPSALRARCWPLLCGAHVCQKNSPGTYQVRGTSGVPAPSPSPSPLWAFTSTFLPTCRTWLRPRETHSGWKPSAGTCTASSLCMRCLCRPRVTGTRVGMPRDP